jgi:hypothetical protein
MIKRIEARDSFMDDIVNPFNKKKVIIVTTEEFICAKFGIDLSENRDKSIDIDSLELEKATDLFDSIKKEITEKGTTEHYYEISPRLDAVIIPNSQDSLDTLKDFIKTEIDIVSE